ncbi:unnamed protein product [Rotaria sp. Silwood2]|nr:unnamed protein product [Rotaria sp. Silwood2]CAF2889902.1 unnamed protein product [Rotaria sp. Silwood2]CAF4451658.1 unnamed protein product [Rotaria sp. Silwood2]CAF4463023.1 unnamed protein product [Rotaria sp. Silwood2]
MNSATILILFVVCLHQIVAVTDKHSSVWQIINNDNRLKRLAMALAVAGYNEGSQRDISMTVFAPNNAAFEKVPTDITQYYSDPANRNELAELLAYHAVTNRSLTSSELLRMDLPARLETLMGGFITVTKQDNKIHINDATVIESDILANNGVIHIIDSVLMPIKSSK